MDAQRQRVLPIVYEQSNDSLGEGLVIEVVTTVSWSGISTVSLPSSRVRGVCYSQSAILIPRLRAFSDTARFIDSDAPSGKSAAISRTRRTDALGSLARTETISSASSTRCIFAVAAGTSAVAWKDRGLAATTPTVPAGGVGPVCCGKAPPVFLDTD